MGHPADQSALSFDEFLRWESAQEVRHEYLGGELFAMTGGTVAHATVTGNINAAFLAQLRNSGCRSLASDVLVRIETVDAGYYPDVVVTCEALEPGARVLREPRLIVEVLSPSTEAFDRGRKFAHYRLLPSLQEYLLADPETRSLEVFRRTGDGSWLLRSYSEDERIHLESCGMELPVAEALAEV
jgi:Uma2 family endonuclease